MNFSEEIVICRFCLGKFTENCEIIGEVVQNSLNFLTLYPNLTISDDPMMCETCAGNLTKCFDIKVKCLSTEDCIAAFTEGEDKKVDLRHIYSKVKLDGNINRLPDDNNVCRLCLKLIKDDTSMSIRHDIDLIEILQKYFLEMDLKITEDIIACTPCFNSLKFCGSFVSNYMNTEKRIDEYCEVEGLNHKGQVDLRDVATFISKSCLNVKDMVIKEERLENVRDANVDIKIKFEDPMDAENEEKLVDKEVQQENSSSFQHHRSPSQSDNEQPYKYDLCNHQTMSKSNMVTHKSSSEISMYKCDVCEYTTKKKSHLKRHMVNHKIHETPEMRMYNCDMCSYKTCHKYYLSRHMLIHMDESKIEMHKCEVCSFKTKWRHHLRSHLRIHGLLPSIMFKCDLCEHMTNRMSNLNSHKLTHKTSSEITMYKCATCSYETKRKSCLRTHMTVHMDESEIEMHKCDVCSFKTRWKNVLRNHMRTHRIKLGAM